MGENLANFFTLVKRVIFNSLKFCCIVKSIKRLVYHPSHHQGTQSKNDITISDMVPYV